MRRPSVTRSLRTTSKRPGRSNSGPTPPAGLPRRLAVESVSLREKAVAGSYDGRMNPSPTPPTMSVPDTAQAPSTVFLVVLFAGAIAIGAAVAYLGIIGVIGGPVP
jgi:hypothetical protein